MKAEWLITQIQERAAEYAYLGLRQPQSPILFSAGLTQQQKQFLFLLKSERDLMMGPEGEDAASQFASLRTERGKMLREMITMKEEHDETKLRPLEALDESLKIGEENLKTLLLRRLVLRALYSQSRDPAYRKDVVERENRLLQQVDAIIDRHSSEEQVGPREQVTRFERHYGPKLALRLTRRASFPLDLPEPGAELRASGSVTQTSSSSMSPLSVQTSASAASTSNSPDSPPTTPVKRKRTV